MTIFCKKYDTAVFIHIPKTGGSSIAKIFSDNGWFESWTCTQDNNTQHRDVNDTKRALIAAAAWTPEEIDIKDIPAFTVVRNPIDRIISEIRGNIEYNNCERHLFNCDDAVLTALKHGSVGGQPLFPRRSNIHIKPMVHFLNGNEKCFQNIKIFKFEDSGHREKIKQMFDLKGKFPHEVGGTYVPDLDYSITQETIDTLKKYYIEDFERFYPELL